MESLRREERMTEGPQLGNTLTNNWAGDLPVTRKGLLPPIRHKLNNAVEKLPVIPPISSKTEHTTTEVRGRNQESEHRAQRNTRSRNNHLRKVYLVSLVQLLAVLLIVVVFTEVEIVREYNNQHSWVGVLLIGKRLTTLSLIIIPSLSPPPDIPLLLDTDSHLPALHQGAQSLQRHHPGLVHSLRGTSLR